MRQFDVFKNPNLRTVREVPLLVNLQHGVLDALKTRLVAPLVPAALGGSSITWLNPIVMVKGHRYAVVMQQAGAIRTKSLGRPVDSLEAHRAALVAALDLLVSGV
ncbi:MAG: CcdB family protein [Myxococcaceae bacterium]|jgi:toxin CcdB|nr:CcdB family protein [Myxococcaceae bacterium]